MKLAAVKNAVIFIDVGYRKFPKLNSLTSLVLLAHTRIFYGLDTTIRNVFGRPYIYLSGRFFKKSGTPHYKIDYMFDAGLLQKYNSVTASYTSGKKFLWLDDDCFLYESKVSGYVACCLNALKCIIDKYFPRIEILYKRHPDPLFHSKDYKSIYSSYEEYPAYMSADFIISDPDIRFILGGFSTVLGTAAEHTDIKAISYVKLIPFEDETYKSQMIEFLMQESNEKVLFPDTMEALEALIRK